MANDISILKTETKNIYNAACCLALSNYPDSAFFVLNNIATVLNYSNYKHITTDQDLISLHNDKRWKALLEIILVNKKNSEADFNKGLVSKLDSIYTDDQLERSQDDAIGERFGWNSEERKNLWRIIQKKDSINLIKVNSIYKEYGWSSTNVIGKQGSYTMFLVIQHSDIKTQEYYLPIIRQVVKDGKLSGQSLALLEDRVALRQEKRQIYGSQIGNITGINIDYVRPLEDPDNVDKRRAEVGLEPMSEYLRKFNLTWDVKQYKKDLQSIERKEKEVLILKTE